MARTKKVWRCRLCKEQDTAKAYVTKKGYTLSYCVVCHSNDTMTRRNSSAENQEKHRAAMRRYQERKRQENKNIFV